MSETALDLPDNLIRSAFESLVPHSGERRAKKARADIEAMVTQRAAQLGVGESDRPLLLPGEGEQ